MGGAVSLSDFYKTDHIHQYPKETTKVYSNFTARSSRRAGVNEVVFFGLQYFIKEYLIKWYNEKFFNLPKDVAVGKYKRLLDNTLGKDAVNVDHIAALHDLGYLPLQIKALPEGTLVPLRVPMLTIVNTKSEFFWLTNFIETIMSCTVWGPVTSATTAFQYRQIFNKYADVTVGNRDAVPFSGHDFSFRGMYGLEAAMMSGAAHLTCFKGTDTLPAVEWLEDNYGANVEKELVGTSIYATEHAVMCVGTGFYVYNKLNGDWDRIGDAEYAVFKKLIMEVYPKGYLSIVSDTFNLWRVLGEYMPRLRNVILQREGKIVIRPDSGDPVKIMTGYKVFSETGDWQKNPEATGEAIKVGIKYFRIRPNRKDSILVNILGDEMSHLEVAGVIESLYDIFEGTETPKGYRLLDPHVGAIYGDSITLERAEQICERLAHDGYASNNWVAGIGSYTYQYVTRDTFGMAMKATYAEARAADGSILPIPIFKDPITDDGTKKSARGLLCVYREDGVLKMKDQCSWEEEATSLLQTVFLDGELTKWTTLNDVRALISLQELAANDKKSLVAEDAMGALI